MSKENGADCCAANADEKPMKDVELFSVITCPECGHHEREEMPTDACQFFYYCKSCKARLRPHPGDCCVYCSYGSVPCPPIQMAGGKDKAACCDGK